MKHIILSTILLGACVGSEIPGPPVQNQPDANTKVYMDAPPPPPDMGPAAGCVDRNAAPATAYIHGGQAGAVGTMAGESCVKSGCHLYGQTSNQAPEFLFGGTIYKPGTTEPDPGVTIMFYPDSAPTTPIAAVSDTAGNFYVRNQPGSATTAIGPNGPIPSAVPASAAATVCPTLIKGHLSGKLTGPAGATSGASCNACHKTEVNDPGTQSAIHY